MPDMSGPELAQRIVPLDQGAALHGCQ
jgi:hypothetical protein